MNGSRILLLGVAYKADVSDVRESPALDVLRLLRGRGAEVHFHDPHVPELDLAGEVLKGVELSDETLEDADLVVVMADHGAVDYARVAARAHRIFDTRNALRDVDADREKIRKL